MEQTKKRLLAIVELGGYPDFSRLYQSLGYDVTVLHQTRKAMAFVKKQCPNVIVAEFNYQSDFRDRTSTMESLLATVERIQQTNDVIIKVIVFYDNEYQQQLEKLQAAFSNFEVLAYPITEAALTSKL